MSQALALSPDGYLWVAGADSASVFPTNPAQLSDGSGANLGDWTAAKVVPLNGDTSGCNLSSGLGDDTVDPCCAAGSYNGGIAINKFSSSKDVYISNECQIGKVSASARSADLIAAVLHAHSCNALCLQHWSALSTLPKPQHMSSCSWSSSSAKKWLTRS